MISVWGIFLRAEYFDASVWAVMACCGCHGCGLDILRNWKKLYIVYADIRFTVHTGNPT